MKRPLESRQHLLRLNPHAGAILNLTVIKTNQNWMTKAAVNTVLAESLIAVIQPTHRQISLNHAELKVGKEERRQSVALPDIRLWTHAIKNTA